MSTYLTESLLWKRWEAKYLWILLYVNYQDYIFKEMCDLIFLNPLVSDYLKGFLQNVEVYFDKVRS